MGKILVIVESPGKIKKLQSILGDKYTVMASIGHIIDLDPKKMSIDIEHNFEPTYKIITHGRSNKEQVVKDLKKAANTASDILLAADEDREGEMIAWSVAHVLGLDTLKAKRITFNSITKSELEKAIANPRTIDMNLVDAQKSRRILDRIIGFEISPILWKSIGASLSAGRVQSVVTKILIDRENEIKEFLQNENSYYFKFTGKFNTMDNILTSYLYEKNIKKITKKDKKENKENKENKEKEDIKYDRAMIENVTDMRKLMKLFIKSKFLIENITEKDSMRNPSPPFTTSTLVQEAARKLGFTVKRTNSAAQKLYEAGYITYMRTDSVCLSSEAMENIKKFIHSKYGKELYQCVNYESKTKNTQEAHEACRPTDVFVEHIMEGTKNTIGADEIKLYNLIWKRTVASMMKPAKIKLTDIIIEATKVKDYRFISQISVIVFQGFLMVYNVSNIDKEDKNNEDKEDDDISEVIIDSIPKIGTELKVNNINSVMEYNKPPIRYNEASIVNKLDPKNLNIGRPSTYGTIIHTIQERGYVVMGNIEGIQKESLTVSWDGLIYDETTNNIMIGKENNKLIPTSLGIQVTEFLSKNFEDIVDYKFTASMEESLDMIAEGKQVWTKVLDTFYKKFHPVVKQLCENNTIKSDMTKVLGNHPKLGHTISASIARFGPVIKMDITKSKCIYAPIMEPLTKDTITLEQALKLLEYPKDLGKYDKMCVSLNRGKHGLYLKWGDVKVSIENLPEEIIIVDKENITLDEAIAVIKDKRKNILWEKIDDKKLYSILSGPYGYYIDINDTSKKIKKNNRVPIKDLEKSDIEKLTLEKVKELIKTGLEVKANRYKKKDTTIDTAIDTAKDNIKTKKNTAKDTAKDTSKDNIKTKKDTVKDTAKDTSKDNIKTKKDIKKVTVSSKKK